MQLVLAVLVVASALGSAAYFYKTGAYQGSALDLRPCDESEVQALASDGFQLESLTVPGATLVGLVRLPKAPDADWVVYFGGNDAHMLRSARAYAELLLAPDDPHGFASFAYRGFDTSTGQAAPTTFGADARAVLDHLRATHDVKAEQVHVVGFSLGANAAALLGESLSHTEQRLASTTLLSPGIAPPGLAEWLFPIVLGAWEMPSKLKAMGGPVLIVSASDDQVYAPDVHARKMPALLGERLVRHVEVTGGHDAALNAPASLEAVRAVIRGQPAAEAEGSGE
jgi:pimeloyl-ACP methyl ester carboxylesterase